MSHDAQANTGSGRAQHTASNALELVLDVDNVLLHIWGDGRHAWQPHQVYAVLDVLTVDQHVVEVGLGGG